MTKTTEHLVHGRETYMVDFGDAFVMKRPLPTFGPDARNAWLAKQHRTKSIIEEISAIKNPRYNIPQMTFIRDDEYQLLEERAPGEHLTPELFKTLPQRQRYEIIDGIASFLVDMNELKPIGPVIKHRISQDFRFNRLNTFIDTKMSKWFTADEVSYMNNVRNAVGAFEYETRMAWSHGDLNSGNVLYDAKTSTLSFIDFAEADYHFIYRDIFAPLQIELDIYTPVYEAYNKLHNKDMYPMPGARNPNLRNIMKYRILVALLRRIIKASDDLRINPESAKGIVNNTNKIHFIREQIEKIKYVEQVFKNSIQK